MTAFEVYHDEFKSMFPDLIENECFIRKPISMDALIRTVKSHLNYNGITRLGTIKQEASQH